MDKRLQKRYLSLVQQHMDAATALAAGIHALPQVGSSFAATQGAWRFFANVSTTLPALVEPLREMGRRGAKKSASSLALVAHDWSKLDFPGHASKKDQTQLSNALDLGYELTTALLVDAGDGTPLAPLALSVLAADGIHTTASDKVQPPLAHLDQILPVMEASRTWGIDKRLVHVIDREADSVFEMRQWSAAGHLFLVRANDRRVCFREKSYLLSKIVDVLEEENEFREEREVTIRGRRGKLFVAECEVTLDGPAWKQNDEGKTYRVPGDPLTLRFVVTQVRDESGKILAQWLLLTNVPSEVDAAEIATWYYWRWRIESFYKLIKAAGLQLEQWQQETAIAISKRLLVACMACVVAWQLEGQTTPQAEKCKKFLVELSGRQTKRQRPVTTPALLAGIHELLLIIGVLEKYTVNDLYAFAASALPRIDPGG